MRANNFPSLLEHITGAAEVLAAIIAAVNSVTTMPDRTISQDFFSKRRRRNFEFLYTLRLRPGTPNIENDKYLIFYETAFTG